MRRLVGSIATLLLAGIGALGAVSAYAQNCSVWLVESSRFMGVPYGAFMPDRAFVPGSKDANNNINTVMTIGYCNQPAALWNYSASGGYVTLQHSVSGLCALAEQTSANSDKVVQWYCMPQYDDQWWYLTNTA